jgi:hypothetical protein
VERATGEEVIDPRFGNRTTCEFDAAALCRGVFAISRSELRNAPGEAGGVIHYPSWCSPWVGR